MTQVSSYITAPYQGVSQAPPQVRLPEQAELLDNCLVIIPQGDTKRPPFQWVGILGSHPGQTDGIFERIERPGTTDAFLTITKESGAAVPRVYLEADSGNIAPQAISVTANGHAYLNASLTTPILSFNVLTVVDYTFVVNRNKVVANGTATAPTRNPEAMVWVRQTGYARTYSVTVNPSGGTPVSVSLHTPNGKDSTDGDLVGTEVLANALYSGSYSAGINGSTITGDLTSLSSQGFTVEVIGPVIYIQSSGNEFTVEVNDDQGGVAMTSIKDKVETFSDLPKRAVSGFNVRITQSSGTAADDFFVYFLETAGPGTGIWQETLAPGANLGLDPTTMPAGLYYSGGWHLDTLGWKQREVGDPTLAPDPDFIGQTVQDIAFWRGRLGIISGEGITLSSSADPFRLYPRTLSEVLASDSIALLSPFEGRTAFTYAVHFDKALVLFGDIGQAEVSSVDAVATTSTTKIDKLPTYFEFTSGVRPQQSNGKVYFVAPHGKSFSTVYEMKVDRLTATVNGEDMTVSVPKFLPAGIDRVASCPVNYLMAYAVSGGTAIYVHLFRYANLQRVQNAWMRWYLPEGYTLGGMLFFNTQLYAVLCRAGVAHLCVLDTAPDLLDEDSTRNLTMLDLRLDETQVVSLAYDVDTDTTTVVIPYPADANIRMAVRAPGGQGGPTIGGVNQWIPEGYLANITSRSGSQFTVQGDFRTVPFYVGYSYTSRHRLSKIYPQAGQDQPVLNGRTSLRKIIANVADTGYLRCEVTASGRAMRSYEYTGFSPDDPDSMLDQSPSGTGTFSVPIKAHNEQVQIDFVNDSHFRSKLLGLEWVAELNTKSSKIG